MAYTSPATVNATAGIGGYLNYANEVTGFWFSRMLMISVFILFIAGYLKSKQDDDFVSAFAVSTFATLLIALPLWIIDFLDGISFGVIIAGNLIAVAILMMDKRGL